jgi:hypothetical protein
MSLASVHTIVSALTTQPLQCDDYSKCETTVSFAYLVDRM